MHVTRKTSLCACYCHGIDYLNPSIRPPQLSTTSEIKREDLFQLRGSWLDHHRAAEADMALNKCSDIRTKFGSWPPNFQSQHDSLSI